MLDIVSFVKEARYIGSCSLWQARLFVQPRLQAGGVRRSVEGMAL
jgi:hypothetical protein